MLISRSLRDYTLPVKVLELYHPREQLMAWRNDGNYSIDNNLAERSFPPLNVQRKYSIMFAIEKGVLHLNHLPHHYRDLQAGRQITKMYSVPAVRGIEGVHFHGALFTVDQYR